MQALFRMAKTETCTCQFSEACQWNELPKVAQVAKSPPASAGDTRDAGLIPWLGRIPWRRKWQPTPVSLAWKIPWTKDPGGLQSME